MTQRLYTLAYPELASADVQWIELEFRTRYDQSSQAIAAAHFTLAFGCDAVDERSYSDHLRSVARAHEPIPFCCRYAMVGKDDSNGNYYVFLVPEEGYSRIAKLHDALYGGPLGPYLRLDIPYVPHITIGTLADAREAKRLCDELNGGGVEVHGKIDRLTLVSFDGVNLDNGAVFLLGAVDQRGGWATVP